jgi:hypothetical protein
MLTQEYEDHRMQVSQDLLESPATLTVLPGNIFMMMPSSQMRKWVASTGAVLLACRLLHFISGENA